MENQTTKNNNMETTINTQSTWYNHGCLMARHMEYGTEAQKEYATSQYEAISSQQYSEDPITSQNCSNFVAGWSKTMMD